jgi:hypothetical protein
MLKLRALSVSLTKHGAHKVADLLQKYGTNGLLERLTGAEPGINIDDAQARSNLSVSGNVVPEVWGKARAAGQPALNALVLIAIIFSHHRLIRAMREGGRGYSMGGIIERGAVLDDKEFTNFAHTIQELGYSTSHSPMSVHYDLRRIFEIEDFHRLALELISLKFAGSVWDTRKSLIDELVEGDLNEVFAISPEQLKRWLRTGDIDLSETLLEDESFFLDAEPSPPAGHFRFTPGHSPKKCGVVDIKPSTKAGKAVLLHNELQTALYQKLADTHGPSAVGTEQQTGYGTSIDLVVKTKAFCWFYEIKTAASLKACVRQAIPQLLEYAYWHQNALTVDRLYVAAKFAPTKEVTEYLQLLRERFSLPIYYEQIALKLPRSLIR